MNKHEWNGGVRYVGGKVEKAIGDAVDSRDWKVDGVVDQVAGAAENTYGRVQSVAEDAIDAAPHIADEARERVADAAGKARDAVEDAAARAAERAREGRDAVARSVDDAPAVWAAAGAALVAGGLGYTLAWLVHGRR